MINSLSANHAYAKALLACEVSRLYTDGIVFVQKIKWSSFYACLLDYITVSLILAENISLNYEHAFNICNEQYLPCTSEVFTQLVFVKVKI